MHYAEILDCEIHAIREWDVVLSPLGGGKGEGTVNILHVEGRMLQIFSEQEARLWQLLAVRQNPLPPSFILSGHLPIDLSSISQLPFY